MTKFEKTLDTADAREHSGLNFHQALSKSDWESHLLQSRSSTSALPSELSFDNTIYGASTNTRQQLKETVSELKEDAYKLTHSHKGGTEYQLQLQKLHADEALLKEDVFALKRQSSDFQSFAGVMNQYHDELKDIASSLWKNGYKSEARHTTAYYPLSHYEHEFADRKGGGNNGGDKNHPEPPPASPPGDRGSIQPPTGSVAFTGLDNANNEKPNIKPNEIGGNGGITSIRADQSGDNTIDFSMEGAGWGDGLWLTSIKNKVTEQTKDFKIQLDTHFTMTESQLKNNNEIEKDIAGPWGIAGTQINTKTGKVDFWDAAGSKWVTVGSLGPLEANKDYHLQIGVTSMGDPKSGTFSYDYYALNGEKLNASQNTFNDKNLHWAPGLYIQTQLDLSGGLY
ncbi:MAG: hypothetical protein HYX67_09030 [Candidatus Melainabacteria bacterium]|nr:hypothetical protein [Candidatus Melainabacteria bacterium]